jgi:hypothetical protein
MKKYRNVIVKPDYSYSFLWDMLADEYFLLRKIDDYFKFKYIVIGVIIEDNLHLT